MKLTPLSGCHTNDRTLTLTRNAKMTKYCIRGKYAYHRPLGNCHHDGVEEYWHVRFQTDYWQLKVVPSRMTTRCLGLMILCKLCMVPMSFSPSIWNHDCDGFPPGGRGEWCLAFCTNSRRLYKCEVMALGNRWFLNILLFSGLHPNETTLEEVFSIPVCHDFILSRLEPVEWPVASVFTDYTLPN